MKKNQRRGKGKKDRRINPKPHFSEERLTSRAGLIPMSRFMTKLGLGAVTDRTLTISRGANADYGPAMIYEAIALGVISGCRHLSDVVRVGCFSLTA